MNSIPTTSLPLNARQLANALIPEKGILEEFLLWPPDLFAFTSQILSLTGAYHLVISPPRCEDKSIKIMWPPVDDWAKPSWDNYVREVGLEWRYMLADKDKFNYEELEACKDQSNPNREKEIHHRAGRPIKYKKSYRWQTGIWVPAEVGKRWITVYSWMNAESNVEDILCNEDEQELTDLSRNWEAFKALITLHAIADEACIGWGIRDLHIEKKKKQWKIDENNLPESKPALYAAQRLKEAGTLSTINNQRCRVLPKRHTPQVGITLRSLSSNLAYHRSSVDVKWKHTGEETVNDLLKRMSTGDKTFSVLLLPWPLHIHALDFRTADKAAERLSMNKEKYGLFSYSPRTSWFNQHMLTEALDSALDETNIVDMVVLPECALSKDEIDDFESVIGRSNYKVSTYIAGVRDTLEGKGSRRFNDNMVYFKMGVLSGKGRQAIVTYPPLDPEINSKDIQYKHHRWKLEQKQITNYSLGQVLSPHKEWWEAIKIRRRKVTFINIGRELTICPLICEDLARQDPIADLIRTVGPSLVITILMDGPQKKDRWSARYASVLSEDPGSAVIALTSFGMVERWRHPYHEPSRVVALWNDGKGLEREIELEEGSIGILLSLSVSGNKEPAADGRVENYATNTVTLGGIHQIRSREYKYK